MFQNCGRKLGYPEETHMNIQTVNTEPRVGTNKTFLEMWSHIDTSWATRLISVKKKIQWTEYMSELTSLYCMENKSNITCNRCEMSHRQVQEFIRESQVRCLVRGYVSWGSSSGNYVGGLGIMWGGPEQNTKEALLLTNAHVPMWRQVAAYQAFTLSHCGPWVLSMDEPEAHWLQGVQMIWLGATQMPRRVRISEDEIIDWNKVRLATNRSQDARETGENEMKQGNQKPSKIKVRITKLSRWWIVRNMLIDKCWMNCRRAWLRKTIYRWAWSWRMCAPAAGDPRGMSWTGCDIMTLCQYKCLSAFVMGVHPSHAS